MMCKTVFYLFCGWQNIELSEFSADHGGLESDLTIGLRCHQLVKKRRRRSEEESYRMEHGFLSLNGFSEVGTPTSSGSFLACCSQ